MAEPITWRNVNSNVGYGVSNALDRAGDTINNGLNSLQHLVRQQQDTQVKNWDNQAQQNTQNFLDRVAAYRSPEELAAAQQSGELDAMRQGYGAQVDRAAVRGAADQQLDLLRQRVTSQNQFQDQQTERGQRASVEQVKALQAAGRFDEANKLAAGLMHGGDLALQSRGYQRENAQDGREDTKLKYEGQRVGLEGARVALARAADARQQTEFNQNQDIRKQTDALARYGQQLIAQGADEKTTREGIIRFANENGINPRVLLGTVAGNGQTFESMTGLTKAQQDKLSGESAAAEAEKARKDADATWKRDQAFAANPVDKVYSFADPDAVTEGQVIDQLKKTIPKQSDAAAKFDSLLGQFKSKAGVDSSKVNLGPILKEALLRTGTSGEDNAWFSFDRDLNWKELSSNLDQVYKESVRNALSLQARDKAHSAFLDETGANSQTARERVQTVKQALTGANKLREASRGQ